MDLQAELDSAASKVQPPSVKPKRGSRGAALYSEENEKGMWYRWFEISSLKHQ